MSLGATRGTVGKLYVSYHAFQSEVSKLLNDRKITKSKYKKMEKSAWDAYEHQEGMLAEVLKKK